MILSLIFGTFVTVLSGVLSFLPKVTTIPWGVDSVLVQGVGYFHFIGKVFPPIEIMLTGFFVVVGFKITLKLVAMIPIVRGLLHKA